MRASVERLTELLGRPPRYLAYPYGRSHAGGRRRGRPTRAARRLRARPPAAVSGDFAVPRVSIVPADGRALFALKTAGRYIGWRHSAPVQAVYGALRPLVRNRWLWP